MANEASGIPSLQILLFRCILHLFFFGCIRFQKIPCCGPPESRKRTFYHACVNIISIGFAYTSFMVVPSGNATTVRKGSSTICSTLLALYVEKNHLTGYDWFGLAGSTLGVVIMVVPDLLNLDKSTQLYDALGYLLACMGGVLLALGLVIFRSLDFPAKLVTVTFLFGAVGSVLCLPAMFLLQDPVLPEDLLTWTCMLSGSVAGRFLPGPDHAGSAGSGRLGPGQINAGSAVAVDARVLAQINAGSGSSGRFRLGPDHAGMAVDASPVRPRSLARQRSSGRFLVWLQITGSCGSSGRFRVWARSLVQAAAGSSGRFPGLGPDQWCSSSGRFRSGPDHEAACSSGRFRSGPDHEAACSSVRLARPRSRRQRSSGRLPKHSTRQRVAVDVSGLAQITRQRVAVDVSGLAQITRQRVAVDVSGLGQITRQRVAVDVSGLGPDHEGSG
uniref:Uncharacterized protein n=1 Tax=Sphaerodactylus townsendi TaxID=933632 RepID=A0ACB8EX67_9SAUR